MENNNLILQPRSNHQIQGDCYDTISRNRPLSYYDNTILNKMNKQSLKNETTMGHTFDNNPSQMRCLATTVPQNIASQDLAGKHAPTRNSLRHSRMIVLNRSGQATTKLPLLIKYYKFVKTLLILITFLGTVLCTLSLLLLLWTPNIRSRDNPYWSAVPVILSGIIGFIFLYFFPRKPPDTKLSYWIIFIKIISVVISLIAMVAAFTICGYAVLHLRALVTMTCSPPDKVNTTCLCSTDPSKTLSSKSYHYIDLTCTDVNNILYRLILFNCTINAIVGILEILYLYIHWCSRNAYAYSRVQTTQHLDKIKKGKR